jgi:hypothetical protein
MMNDTNDLDPSTDELYEQYFNAVHHSTPGAAARPRSEPQSAYRSSAPSHSYSSSGSSVPKANSSSPITRIIDATPILIS